MKELRVKDKVILEDITKNIKIEGHAVKIEYDRIVILVLKKFLEQAKEIEELDDILLNAYTHLGLKQMKGSVIDGLNRFSKITIENNPTILVEQKRNFVRVVCNFDVVIIKDEKEYTCKAKDISASGIAISANNNYFEIDDNVQIKFPPDILDKEIIANAKIVKMNELNYALRYDNLDIHDQNKIMKYVFKIISDNKHQ